jgi:hypothetical protein
MPQGHVQRPGLGPSARDDDNLQAQLSFFRLPLHPTKADRYLLADHGVGPVVAKAREIRSLTQACAALLPSGIAPQLRLAHLKDGELVLLAANPSAAAKLKLVAESLRKFLLQQGSKVNSVSVRVQPTRSQPRVEGTVKRAHLSDAGKAELSALYDRLPGESPVRAALAGLLRGHSPKERSQAAPRTAAAGKGPRRRGPR